MNNFRDLAYQEKRLQDGIQHFSSEDKKRIISARELAERAHEGQKRDEGDLFIIHPIRMANMLLYDLGVDDLEIIIAGLLHDVVEDSDITAEEITQQFGERVGSLVIALTRYKDKETKREKFEKDMVGPEDIRLIKTCDWLDNLRSLPYHLKRDEKFERIKREAREMYITLAEATGNPYLINEMKVAYDTVVKS